MKSNERSYKFFDLRLEVTGYAKDSGTITLTPKPLVDVPGIVDKYHKDGGVLRENRARTETWYLADISIDRPNNKAILLINRSDRLGADQAISSPLNRQHRVASKGTGEENVFPAHLALNLEHGKMEIISICRFSKIARA